MKKKILGAVSVGLSIASMPAMAAAYGAGEPDIETVQTVIEGFSQKDLTIPRDGSNCDPGIIAANLKRLNVTGILMTVRLSETVATGHCYGYPCSERDMEKALEAHCKKADALKSIVDAVKDHP